MSFLSADVSGLARALGQIADSSTEHVELFLERSERLELPSGESRRARTLCEEGFAVRMVDRTGRCWGASSDRLETEALRQALRRTARGLSTEPVIPGGLAAGPWPGHEAGELVRFAPAVRDYVESLRVGFRLRLSLERHRRWLQVVTPELVPAPQQESFYACLVETERGRFGSLLPDLEVGNVQRVADRAVAGFLARGATSPPSGRATVVLGSDAAAVLLHEVIGHGLEADLLARTGRPEAAIGVQLANPSLSVLDDPTSAPLSCRRSVDDEGTPVTRRWLLRRGQVEQPLADRRWASAQLLAGAGRRSDRHHPPLPRSSHLDLLAGEASMADLMAGEGWFAQFASRGSFDPIRGHFSIELSHGRRFAAGDLGSRVGGFRLVGTVAELLASVEAVGDLPVPCGAGWCAKGGQKLPVWATAPALRIEGVQVVSP